MQTRLTNRLPRWLMAHTEWVVASACIAAAILYLFHPGLGDSTMTVWSSDYGMAQHTGLSESARVLGPSSWNQVFYLGGGGAGPLVYPNWPLIAILPVGTSMWMNVAIHMLWAGVGAWYCARQIGVGRWGAALTGIAFGLTSHLVSLLYPGHIQKIQAIPWIPWTFAFFWRGWQIGKVRDFLLAAMCLAVSFQSGEPQVPLYLGLCLVLVVAQFMLRTIVQRKRGWAVCISNRLLLSAACAIAALCLSWQSVSKFAGLLGQARGAEVSQIQREQSDTTPKEVKDSKSDAESYAFATGWSFPPEDMLTFFMTGQLFGGKSPGYWGRMGTDAMTLKQTDDYVGVFVFIMALVGLLALRKERGARFAVLLLLVTLAMGLGKYTPIYRLFYSLPGMQSQRVPARWIALSAFALTLLAGFGFERYLAACHEASSLNRKRWLALPVTMVAMAGTLIMFSLLLGTGRPESATRLFGPEGLIAVSAGTQLAELRIAALLDSFRSTRNLLLAGALLAFSGLYLPLTFRSARSRSMAVLALASACLILVTVDLTRNAKHFVEFYNWKRYHQADALVNAFKQDPDICRVQPLGMQHPVMQRMVGPVGSFHHVRLTEQTSLNVIPHEYAEIYGRASSGQKNYRLNPRYYDLFNVKYVLSAFQLPPEILKYADLALIQKIPYGQNVPPVFLYRYRGFEKTPAFVSQTISCRTYAVALNTIFSPDFDPDRAVAGVDLPAIPDGAHGKAQLLDFGRRTIKIAADNDGPGWVTCKVKYTPDWRAFVDDDPAQVYRVNHVHVGVPVPKGQHQVRFVFSTSRRNVNITWASWMLACFALIVLVHPFRRLRHQLGTARQTA